MEGAIIRKLFIFLFFLGSFGISYRLKQRLPSWKFTSTENSNLVTSETKAKEILIRYGYLKCNSKKSKMAASNGNSNKFCSKRQTRDAIKRYQQVYGMPLTGRLDEETLKHMSMSRCGNSDNFADSGHRRRHNKRHPNSVLPIYYRRSKRHVENNSKTNDDPYTLGKGMVPRRKAWMKEYIKKLEMGKLGNRTSDEVQRALIQKRRRKRSAGKERKHHQYLVEEMVTWRLASSAYSGQMSINVQRAAFALAFRMWSEVIPLIFWEDTKSPVEDVDILLAFGRGEHLNCPNRFDGYGGQLSHAINMAHNSEIHVDDDEFFTIGSEQGTNLVKVAIHEVGHTLGLFHTSHQKSIMHAVYSKIIPTNNFELEWEDRKTIQRLYGVCKGRFDAVFDWVRSRPDGQFIYNTYFFRKNKYWMYENRHNRTRYGDPHNIEVEWKGLPSSGIDGYAHVWTYSQNNAYFFKGSHYWLYDSNRGQVMAGYPRNISEDFRAVSGSKFPNIPDHIDTVYFDRRDENLYFFKGNLVYGYDVSRGKEGCCLPGYPRFIKKEFPSLVPKSHLPSHLDGAYFSYTDRTLYFFKGNRFWKNVKFNINDKNRVNRINGPWEISSHWHDICQVDL
ncbi:matrix metalloproteinase-21-like [Centruroides vittatus]|uniref:matrix metalloproteinase-21-like n=1 Tax=Centruroides vittatus TaxID=120091 RepID=UPI00350ED2D0